MALTVEDFHDLVRLLEQRPEWRMELRRLVLTEELLSLPAIVQELAQAQQRTEQQVRELQIVIDEARQAQKVAEITETDYFQQLRGQAADLRRILE